MPGALAAQVLLIYPSLSAAPTTRRALVVHARDGPCVHGVHECRGFEHSIYNVGRNCTALTHKRMRFSVRIGSACWLEETACTNPAPAPILSVIALATKSPRCTLFYPCRTHRHQRRHRVSLSALHLRHTQPALSRRALYCRSCDPLPQHSLRHKRQRQEPPPSSRSQRITPQRNHKQ